MGEMGKVGTPMFGDRRVSARSASLPHLVDENHLDTGGGSRHKKGRRIRRAGGPVATLGLLAGTLVTVGQIGGGGAGVSAAPVGAGFVLNVDDLRFIFHQIEISEAHAGGGALFGPGPNQVNEARLPFGL